MWYAQLIGYGFSIFVEALFVRNVVNTLWDCIAPGGSSNPQIRPNPWQGQALSLVESVLYIAFLQAGFGYLIGVWLALKVVGQWKRWQAEGDGTHQRPDGRSVFNIYMVGNAFTLVYSYIGFKLIGWLSQGRILRACWVPLGIIVLTILFWLWLRRFRKLPAPTPETTRVSAPA